MSFHELSIEEIMRGFVYDEAEKAYKCAACAAKFEEGEVFPMNGRFYDARLAMRRHMDAEHGDYLVELIDGGGKYNSFTENQKNILKLFASGLSDNEIARLTGVTTSTVRHQKFVFREKAKQARRYLAVYESVFGGENKEKEDGGNRIMPIHDNATMTDERFVITEKERDHILKTAFVSLEPLKLRQISPKEKKKIVILARIAQEFELGIKYTEKQVNEVLMGIFEDHVTLRRYLIEYGYMQRTANCSEYWLV